MLFKNLPVEQRKKLQAESKKQFAEIYEKTLAAFGLTPDRAPCRGGFQECWNDLLNVWDQWNCNLSCDVFYAAVYHAAWNRYPVGNLSDAEMALFAQVEEILSEEGYAYAVLCRTHHLHRAVDLVEDSIFARNSKCRCKSLWFGRYIYAKVCNKFCLKGNDSRHPYGNMFMVNDRFFPSETQVKETPVIFEAAIKQLLPAAVKWTEANWCDESFIFGEIYQNHGVDYSQRSDSFDYLVDALDKKSKGQAYDIRLMWVEELSVSMVPCIWPRNHKKSVECFLTRLCKRVKERELNPSSGRSFYTRENLKSCWVVKQYARGCWPIPKDLKRMVFELSVC